MYKPQNNGNPVIEIDPEESRVQAHEAGNVDIKSIIARWRKTRQVVHIQKGTPFYGDFTGGSDFQVMLDRVKSAMDGFQTLPAEVRDACANDPGVFLDMIEDPESFEELKTLGLVEVEEDDERSPGDPVRKQNAVGGTPPSNVGDRPPPKGAEGDGNGDDDCENSPD